MATDRPVSPVASNPEPAMSDERRAEIERAIRYAVVPNAGWARIAIELLAEVDRRGAEIERLIHAIEQVRMAESIGADKDAQRRGRELLYAAAALPGDRQPDRCTHDCSEMHTYEPPCELAAPAGDPLPGLGASVVREYPDHEAAVRSELARRAADPLPQPEPPPESTLIDRMDAMADEILTPMICTTPAYGAPGRDHCAACCYGTGYVVTCEEEDALVQAGEAIRKAVSMYRAHDAAAASGPQEEAP